MVIRVSKFVGEVLAKALPSLSISRQSSDILVSDDDPLNSSLSVLVSKSVGEVIAKTPPEIAITRQSVQTLVLDNNPLNALIPSKVSKIGAEVLSSSPFEIAITRQSVQTLVLDNDALNTSVSVLASRIYAEALGRSSAVLDKKSIPAGLQFYAHNWADSCVMSSSYSTDICKSPTSLTESRRGLADRPVRSIDVRWTISGEDGLDARTKIGNFMVELRRLMSNESAIPFYMDQMQLDTFVPAGATSKTIVADFSRVRIFTNSLVVIVHTDFSGRVESSQFVFVASYQGNKIVLEDGLISDIIPGRTFVAPMMFTESSKKIVVKQITDRVFEVNLSVDEKAGRFAIPPVSTDLPAGNDHYLDIPILSAQPNRALPLLLELTREGSSEMLGRAVSKESRGSREIQGYRLSFSAVRRSQIGWELIQFWDSRRGRLRPFWVVPYEIVYEVNQIEVLGFVNVQPLGAFSEFTKNFNHLGLVFSDGTSYVSEVISIQDLTGQWRIALDAVNVSLPAGKTAADVVRVGKAYLARNRSDSLRESWTTDGVVSIIVDTIELLSEVDQDLL